MDSYRFSHKVYCSFTPRSAVNGSGTFIIRPILAAFITHSVNSQKLCALENFSCLLTLMTSANRRIFIMRGISTTNAPFVSKIFSFTHFHDKHFKLSERERSLKWRIKRRNKIAQNCEPFDNFCRFQASAISIRPLASFNRT